MAAGRPRGQNDPSLISSLETAVREVRRPGPIRLAWSWRVELGMLAAIAGLSALIADSVGLIGLAAVAGAGLAVGAALLCWPPARKQIFARAWCVITPHRILVGCANAWVQTRRGRLPFLSRYHMLWQGVGLHWLSMLRCRIFLLLRLLFLRGHCTE